MRGLAEDRAEDRGVRDGQAKVDIGPEPEERTRAPAVAGVGAEPIGRHEHTASTLALTRKPAEGTDHKQNSPTLTKPSAVSGGLSGEDNPPFLACSQGITGMTKQDQAARTEACTGPIRG